MLWTLVWWFWILVTMLLWAKEATRCMHIHCFRWRSFHWHALVKKRLWETTEDARWDIEYIRVWSSILQKAVTFGESKGFTYPIVLSRAVVFHFTFNRWKQPRPWENETLIRNILPFSVISSNSDPRTCDRCSPSYAFMTVQVIGVIWYAIPRNSTTTISSMKCSITRYSTHKLYVYDLARSFNRRPVRRAVTVIASYWASCLYRLVLLMIHASVKDCYWSKDPTTVISSCW
jgi:hypothetical protein